MASYKNILNLHTEAVVMALTSELLPFMHNGSPFPYDVITIMQHLYPPLVLRLKCTFCSGAVSFSNALLLTPSLSLEQVIL